MENEIWKDIIGYEGIYQVSSLGRIKSLARRRFNHNSYYNSKEMILSHCKGSTGYYQVGLCKNGKAKSLKVHKLVAMAFLGHIPCGYKLVIDHINDNPLDNRLENLQIITQRENVSKTQGKYSSKYKGVSFCNKSGKWVAMIFFNKNKKYLGSFINEYEAHLAYQNKLKEIC